MLIADDGLRADVAALVEDARTKADFAMKWGNRRIAHLDLELALRNEPVDPLPEATRTNVEAALASLRAVIGGIEPRVLQLLHGLRQIGVGCANVHCITFAAVSSEKKKA